MNSLLSRQSDISALPRAASRSGTLRIRPGDMISISIFEANSEATPHGLFSSADPTQKTGGTIIPNQQVDNGGHVMVPFAGSIQVAGKTPQTVSAEISELLKSRALDPQVVVSIVERHGESVSVLGDVVTPAHFPIDPGGVTLLDAIARSGGTKSQDFETEVVLQRAGHQFRTRLSDVTRHPELNVNLIGGDVVFLSHDARFVTVFGALSDASNTNITHRILFQGDTETLSEAMSQANGLSDVRADPKQVFLLRYVARRDLPMFGVDSAAFPYEVVPTVFSINLASAEGMFVSDSLKLQSHDVIVAADSPWIDVTKLFGYLDIIASPYGTVGTGTLGFK